MLAVDSLMMIYTTGSHDLTVLKDISFRVDQGEACSLVGPSGSGKTTLLGLCAGLDRPTRGSVSLLGVDLTTQTEDELASLRGSSVGFVFQSFQLIPTLTAMENVMVPLELLGVSSDDSEESIAERAVRRLSRVGLGDRLDHYPAQLSGGEQQRVAIARAFINQPRILFADEPTGNLDAATSHTVVDLLFELNHEAGTTLLMATHDQDLANRTDRVIQLRGGELVSDEKTNTKTRRREENQKDTQKTETDVLGELRVADR